MINKNQKIRQSNHLIESPYAQEFSAHEIKIFEIAIAGVTIEDNNKVLNRSNKRISLSSNQLATLLNTSVSVISHEIEKTATKIMKKTIHLRKVLDNGTIEFEMANIIPFAKYKNGEFEFDLNYAIIPYINEINKNFTEYQLHYLLLMRSAYAIKLYKLLYQYKNIKCRTFDIADLKEQFGIVNKYPQYKNLKQKVLEPSVLQINELTDLDVTYNEIKSGRKVDKIIFKFEVKKPQILSPETKPNNSENIQNLLSNVNDVPANLSILLGDIEAEISSVTKELVLNFYKDKGSDYVEASIAYARKNAKTNLDKYLSDTLINGWAEVEIKKIVDQKAEKLKRLNTAKLAKTKKELELEQDKLNKLNIEFEWDNLTDDKKEAFTVYATQILQNYSQPLKIFKGIETDLHLSVYAVSNSKNYDKIREYQMTNFLKINLAI